MKKPTNSKRRSIEKARNVVVAHSDKKDPPDLARLAKALIAWKLGEAHAVKPLHKKPDQ